jgi:hypothetical protein
VTVRSLDTGEALWRRKTSGEVVVADGRLLVPGGNSTSLVYSLRDTATKRLKTGAALRATSPGVRILDGPLVAMVGTAGEVPLLDLAEAVEADRPVPTAGPVEAAWLAGPFLITSLPLSVTHLWGGVATTIPLPLDTKPGTLVAGPGQALVRGADRSAWLEFS